MLEESFTSKDSVASLFKFFKEGMLLSRGVIVAIEARRGSILAEVTLVLTPRKKSLGKHLAPEAMLGAYLLRLQAFELFIAGSVFCYLSSFLYEILLGP